MDPPVPHELVRAITSHAGDVNAIARDVDLLRALGHPRDALSLSKLYALIREHDLKAQLDQARDGARQQALDAIVSAVRETGSASDAAQALGMTRDALVWQLRKAGLTVKTVLTGR